jgi:choline dehydrogenase-like flavoprotein
VTDASAFPTASGVNPMLAIMALARRTAQRMVAG